MYQTSDSTLARIKDATALVVGFAIARTYEQNSEFIIQDGNIADESDSTESNSDTPNSPKNQKDDQLKLGYNTHVLLYSNDGVVVNPDNFTGLSDLSLDKKNLGEIKEATVDSTFGGSEDYRYVTIELAPDDLG